MRVEQVVAAARRLLPVVDRVARRRGEREAGQNEHERTERCAGHLPPPNQDVALRTDRRSRRPDHASERAPSHRLFDEAIRQLDEHRDQHEPVEEQLGCAPVQIDPRARELEHDDAPQIDAVRAHADLAQGPDPEEPVPHGRGVHHRDDQGERERIGEQQAEVVEGVAAERLEPHLDCEHHQRADTRHVQRATCARCGLATEALGTQQERGERAEQQPVPRVNVDM